MDNPFEEYANSSDCEVGIAMSHVAPNAIRATNCVLTLEDGTQMDIGDAWLLRASDGNDATGESDG